MPQPPSALEDKDDQLDVLSARPLVLQTPLELSAGRPITDTQYLYVRNVEDLPGSLGQGRDAARPGIVVHAAGSQCAMLLAEATAPPQCRASSEPEKTVPGRAIDATAIEATAT